MKKIIAIFFLTGIFALAKAQPYGNEWIDYTKTYYKFKVANTSLYRIPYSILTFTGIPANQLKGSDFKLFRNGNEVPLYVTTSGLFGANDYIEFFGEKNDGKPDSLLYKDPSFQPSNRKSLFGDSATFFLTLDPFNINARIQSQSNDLTLLPPAEKYCYTTSNEVTSGTSEFSYFRGLPISSFFSQLYNSDFDYGEGYLVNSFSNSAYTFNYLLTPYAFKDSAVNAFFTFRLLQGIGNHKINIKLSTLDTTFISSTITPVTNLFRLNIGNNLLNTTKASFAVSEQIPSQTNYLLSGSLQYPRKFDFGNVSKFNFEFYKKDELYFEVRNFNNQNTNPILYDLTNNQRYVATKDSVLKFHLYATARNKERMFISSQATADIPVITNFTATAFTNFLANNQQGDYLIISNKKLKSSTASIDYIEEYRKYRASVSGGSYTARTYFIDELNDQFGFGINGHPLTLRNFSNFCIDKFVTQPQLMFIIGKGYNYTSNQSLVQTYGEPASDNLVTARNATLNYPQLGTGRLSVTKGDDIKVYLDKVREYEYILNDTFNSAETPANKLWMKNILNLGGGNNNFEQQLFRSYLDSYKTSMESPYYGARAFSLFKNSTDPIQIAQNIFIDSLVNTGVSVITFFGHSATTTLDFNLDPDHFDNYGKYHLMVSNGCFVGSIFENFTSLSERFVLAPRKAGIGYLAPVTYAVATNLNVYTSNFFNRLSNTMYNDKIGNILKETSKQLMLAGVDVNYIAAEQMVYHGDPGLRINSHFRPDYYIDQNSISFEPQNINAASDSFLVKVIVKNLGRAIDDNYIVNIDRIFPNGQIQVTQVTVPSARNIDTVLLWIKSDRINGPGLNTFKIKVDYNNTIPEYSEQNNEVTITKLILADDIIPIYPYDFCIVNDPNFELVFSTASAFATAKKYIIQIDTTELFNSPILTQVELTLPGASIHWKPTIQLLQNKVYYWRGTLDTISGVSANWKYSSFLYNTSLSTGWNQSHYYQYLKNTFSTLNLKNDRIFRYPNNIRTLYLRNGNISDQLIELYWDGYLIQRNAWARKGFIFFVYDGNTGQAWQSYQIGNTGRGPYNDITSSSYPRYVAEFITNDNTNGKRERKYAYDFLNSIPCNAYVLGYSFYNAGYSQWLGDSTNTGDWNLYQAFENLGVSKIRQQQESQPFTFFLHKCDPLFQPIQLQRFSPSIIDTTFTFNGSWTKGDMESPIIGPAKDWKNFDMLWSSRENPSSDQGIVNIFGYDTLGTRTLIANNLDKGTVTPITVDAKRFPFMQMQWLTKDDTTSTPPQMDYWRLYYDKAPEAVVNPTIHFVKSRDTIMAGEDFNMSVAVENVTPINMDSLLVRFIIRDASNNITTIYKRFAPLPGKQSLNIDFNYSFQGFNFFGLNFITVEVNPDDDQVEQFHFNNFAEFTLYVDRDRINPLFDITFDGRHITDGEYVSSNPEILFRLKDENKYLALNDTSEFLVYMFYPNDPTNPVQLNYNQSDITYVPASNTNLGRNNEARLIYKPTLSDGTYEIRAQGIDRSNNDAGKYDYRIKFKVDSRPSITNILNYPNPFSTSTQFVFTLTGATIPDQLIIQIFSASGKVVKEITREQLGTLHIGTNLTDYKWDGTDNYGDRLANGVYFYRVMTKNIDGTTTEVKQSSIDKFFKRGYGKLYIIR